jgi:hypothetical protein
MTDVEALSQLSALPAVAQGRFSKQLPYWRTGLVVAATAAIGALILLITMQVPLQRLGATDGGPFWNLPAGVWLGVAFLAALCLMSQSPIARTVAVVCFGLATMGVLAFIEPLGVFHDSWQNAGLGQLAVSPDYVMAASGVPYVASSPGSFLFYGVLSSLFPDTASFLRVYPMLCVLLYCAGLYALATAFADAHMGRLKVERIRFGLLTVFAFLALAPLFYVRINPAPQSLAFALMPFCLATVLNGASSARFRVLGLLAFAAMVVTHPITALMTSTVAAAWLFVDWVARVRRKETETPTVSFNTVLLYVCLFVSWMVYVGAWVIKAGGSFFQRMLDALNSGQHSTVTASSSTDSLQSFIWLHRAALGSSVLLILAGLVAVFLADRLAGVRLLAWLGMAAAWLPLLFFGEFGDRGPLFASLPAALAVGFILSTQKHRLVADWLVGGLMLLAAVTNYVTAYPNHTGEVVTPQEVAAFHVIVQQSEGRNIAYAYAPPLSDDQLATYAGGKLRAFAVGAADFSYDRLTKTPNVIVISEQMRQVAALRGPDAVAALDQFEAQLLNDPNYELIFDNGSVRAFRAR